MDKQEGIKGESMFYTYLRGLVTFILWVLNGNAHYHHGTIRVRRKLHSRSSSSNLVGSCLHGLCDKPSNLSLWLRKNSLPMRILAGGFTCWGFPN